MKQPKSLGTARPISRELSHLAFTTRIVEEVEDPRNPLGERIRFVAIAAANLHEFFMTHVARIERRMAAKLEAPGFDEERLESVRAKIDRRSETLGTRLSRVWTETLVPELVACGIEVLPYATLESSQRALLDQWFDRELAPTLRRLELAPGTRPPSDACCVPSFALLGPRDDDRVLWIEAPPATAVLAPLASHLPAASLPPSRSEFVEVAEILRANLPRWLAAQQDDAQTPSNEGQPARHTTSWALRILRAADDDPDYAPGQDPRHALEASLLAREQGFCVRIELDADAPETIRQQLARAAGARISELAPLAPFRLAAGYLRALLRHRGASPNLWFPPLAARRPALEAQACEPLSALARQDQLLYHPYDSFDAVLDFIRSAVQDPATRRLSLTLYRSGLDTPLAKLLCDASAAGIQTQAFVELRARFDERTNLELAERLTQAGVEVIYGPPGLKLHAKFCLIERQEADALRPRVHLGTGNYHHLTATSYTDLSLLSADPEICADVVELLRSLCALPPRHDYRALLISPGGMREALTERIAALIEAQQRGEPCLLMFKMNALVDDALIDSLYQASRAGVRTLLQVRGCCRLRPGVPGISDNIEVMSLVGRFLEHSRLYYFKRGEHEELLTGSADLMPRNLDRRIEVLFPIKDPQLRAQVRDDILAANWRDEAKTRFLGADALYTRPTPSEGELFDIQARCAREGWRQT